MPVVIDNLQYFEIIGSDFWLCMDVSSMKSCVSSSGETQVSPWYSTEGEAIVALKRAMEMEADNVLAS